MSPLRKTLNKHGKAMVLALVIPIAVPAVIGSVSAVRLLANQEDLNPSVDPYHEKAAALDASVKTLQRTIVEESTAMDWAEWDAVVRVQEQAMAEAPPPPPPEPKPDIRIEYRLRLDGIVWHVGRPYAFINRKLVGLNETVDGCTVTHIAPNSVVLLDPTGREHRFHIDDSLREQYPGYNAQ